MITTGMACGLPRKSETCQQKLPLPKEKIYEENTIEVGVYIDRHLYKVMEEALKTQDEGKVKEQLLKMVHSLFWQVENFLMHPTMSSKGGLKIVINGITIYKNHGKLEADWDQQTEARYLVKAFQGFANKVNGNCDGDQDSYDAMVLLTGRYDWKDLANPTGSIGFAMVGKVCTIAPVIILTLRLDEEDPGNHELAAPNLLAHEFGHLLGSDHDFDIPRYNVHSKEGVFPDGKSMPCPNSKFLMAPAVGPEIKTWSECTKKMVDHDFERREKKNNNCFFT